MDVGPWQNLCILSELLRLPFGCTKIWKFWKIEGKINFLWSLHLIILHLELFPILSANSQGRFFLMANPPVKVTWYRNTLIPNFYHQAPLTSTIWFFNESFWKRRWACWQFSGKNVGIRLTSATSIPICCGIVRTLTFYKRLLYSKNCVLTLVCGAKCHRREFGIDSESLFLAWVFATARRLP